MNKKIYTILLILVLITAVFTACAPNEESSDAFTISQDNATLVVGTTLTLTTQNQKESVSWTSSNPSVATVENGVVTAISYGSAEIVATSGDESAKCIVTVVFASTNYTVRVTLNENDITLNTFYTNTKTFTLVPTITDNGVECNKTVEWLSSNTSVATVENGVVTALSNGNANITATVREGEKYAQALCVVTVKDDVEISISGVPERVNVDEEIDLSTKVEVKINKNIQLNPEIVWTSSDESIATVVGGVVRTYSGGYVTITATAFGESKSVGILVGDVILVSSAEDLINLYSGVENATYKLTNNIDMSAYLAQNPWNSGSIISNFSGVLDGNGYAITGINRNALDNEGKGAGFFGTIQNNAIIKNLYIEIDYVSKNENASVLVSELYGKIQNCYIKAKVYDYSNGDSQKISMIGANLGSTDLDNASVYRTVFDIKAVNISQQEVAITPFSMEGSGAYNNAILFSNKLATYSSYLNGYNSSANENLKLCFYYPTVSDFTNGTNSKKITSAGITGTSPGRKYLSWDTSVWNISQSEQEINLVNDKNIPVQYAPIINAVTYSQNYELGDQITLIEPEYKNADDSQTGLELSIDVFDSIGRNLNNLIEDGKFTPTSIGSYKVVYTVSNQDTGLENISFSYITVQDPITVNTGVKFELILPVNGEKSLTPSIVGATGDSWTYSSDDETIATVNSDGKITARGVGSAVITVKHVETNRVGYVVVRSYANMIAINSETEFTQIGEDDNPNNYYYLTKDLDFSSGEWLKVNDVSTSNVKYYSMATNLYGTFDGNGHTITFNYSDVEGLQSGKFNDGDKRTFAGLFIEINRGAKVKNLILYSDLKPQYGYGASFLALRHYGEIVDSYFNVIAETDGVDAGRAYACAIVGRTADYLGTVYGKFTRCIASVNVAYKGELSNSAGFATHYSLSLTATVDRNAKMTDCMLIGKANLWMMVSVGKKIRSYGYSDFDAFFKGNGYHTVTEGYGYGNMKLNEPNSNVRAYENSAFEMSEWDIKEDGTIKLCGRELKTTPKYILSYSDGLTVKWNTVEGATGYQIYKGDSLIETTSSTLFRSLDYTNVYGDKAEYSIKIVPVFGETKGEHYTVASVKYELKGSITNVAELKELKNETESGAIYSLANDITITNDDLEWFTLSTNEIGMDYNVLAVVERIKCVLNGNGHKITVVVNENALSQDNKLTAKEGNVGLSGLFAYVEPNARVTDIYFDVTSTVNSDKRVGACAFVSFGKFENCYVDYKDNRTGEYSYGTRKICMVSYTVTWNTRTDAVKHGKFENCLLKIVARHGSSILKAGGFGGGYDGSNSVIVSDRVKNNEFINCIYITEKGADSVFSNVSGTRKNCYVFASTNDIKSGSGYALANTWATGVYVSSAGSSDMLNPSCVGANTITGAEVLSNTSVWNNGTWSLTNSSLKFYNYDIA